MRNLSPQTNSSLRRWALPPAPKPLASWLRLSARLLQSQDEERRRIARDLHDITGQELAVLGMSLELAARNPDETRPGSAWASPECESGSSKSEALSKLAPPDAEQRWLQLFPW